MDQGFAINKTFCCSRSLEFEGIDKNTKGDKKTNTTDNAGDDLGFSHQNRMQVVH